MTVQDDEAALRHRHRECGPDCCITGDRCEDAEPESSAEAREPVVLIPDRWGGLVVVEASDLLGRLASGESLEDAITNSGFDSSMTARQVPGLIARVRALNETGDINAYWNPSEET